MKDLCKFIYMYIDAHTYIHVHMHTYMWLCIKLQSCLNKHVQTEAEAT